MGLTKQQQLELHRKNGTSSLSAQANHGVKHIIAQEVKFLSKKQNAKRNKKRHRPPKIFYGYNTNK
jgi:hypothetical protein